MYTVDIATKIDHEFNSIVTELYPSEKKQLTKACMGDDSLLYTIKVCEGSTVRGRLGVFNNKQMKLHEPTWAIGLYEAIDDIRVVDLLFQSVHNLATGSSVSYLVGPMNGSTWFNYRLPQESNKLFFTEEACMPYYTEHFRHLGFKPIAKYYSAQDYGINQSLPIDDLLVKFYNQGLHVRAIDLDNYEAELHKLFDLISHSFKNNFLFTPISIEDFLRKYLPLKKYIDPNYFLIAEDATDCCVGFFLCLPDHYSCDTKTLVAKSLARLPGYQWAGLGSVLSEIIMRKAESEGYTSIIHAFMHEDNKSFNISKSVFSNIINHYYLYGKHI